MEHAETGRDLYASGDDFYDFFLLLTATVDIVRDATAIEPERLVYQGGPGDFLGELNLLTGQHVYLTARVVSAGTVVRIGAVNLRRVLAEQDDIADLLLAAFRERREVIRSACGSAWRSSASRTTRRPSNCAPTRRRCSCRIPGAMPPRTPGDR
ncbi:cyclic nucleotide-binding domain-containing protein [Streptosporangium lutulentum]